MGNGHAHSPLPMTVDCWSPIHLVLTSLTRVYHRLFSNMWRLEKTDSLDVTWKYYLFKPGLIWCLICVVWFVWHCFFAAGVGVGCFWDQVCFLGGGKWPSCRPLTLLGCKTNVLADEENRLWSKSGKMWRNRWREGGGSVRGQLERQDVPWGGGVTFIHSHTLHCM